MRQNYTPIFRSTLTSRVWALPDAHRVVWLWLQLHCDPEGFVCADLAGVAIAARVSAQDARDALEVLSLPDADADPEDPHEGRIIERVPKGWRVLSFGEQRELARREARNARNAGYMRANRARAANDVEPVAQSVPSDHPHSENVSPNTKKQKQTNSSEDRRESPLPPVAHPLQEASGTRTVWRDLKGWAMSASLRSEAVMAGVPDGDIDGYVSRLGNGPIGGTRGVFDRDDYVRGFFGKWRTWSEIERAKAPAPGSPVAASVKGMPPWVRKEHQRLAGAELKALAQRFAKEHHIPPSCLKPAEAATAFTKFLERQPKEAA